MNIQVRFFASLRETLGSGAKPLLVPNDVMTVGELRAWLCLQSAAHAEALAQTKAVRAALNQTMCADDTALIEGAEVAFFPPVTGG
jgi:sulfur-carrier protein